MAVRFGATPLGNVFRGDMTVNVYFGDGQLITGSEPGVPPPPPPVDTLDPGLRAAPGLVGYLGDPDDLTVLNHGDSLPAEWSATWFPDELDIHADNITVDHYRINAGVQFYGDNPTMTNCVVHATSSSGFWGVFMSDSGSGKLTITDTTVVATSGQNVGVSSGIGMVAQRCDVSGSQDGIHFTSDPDPDNTVISQCYVHDLSYALDEQHCDAMQCFNSGTSTGDPPTYATVEHCHIAETIGTGEVVGIPINSALTIGGTPTQGPFPNLIPVMNNNFFESGLYHLRLNYWMADITVTNSDFGPLHTGEFGLFSYDNPDYITTWTNNRDHNGDLIGTPT